MNEKKKILVVDDEQDLRELLFESLEFMGFSVDTAINGEDALNKLFQNKKDLSVLSSEDIELLQDDDDYKNALNSNENYDLIILDEMMPKLNGTKVIENLRQNNVNIPVIFLSAKDSLATKLKGFDEGAYDYVLKPFDIEELVARINVVLSKKSVNNNMFSNNANIENIEVESQNFADIIIDNLIIRSQAQDVLINGELVDFTAKQYSILKFLCKNIGQLITKEQIYEEIWGYAELTEDISIVETYICAIRKKLKNYKITDLIETKRGIGYIVRKHEE